MRTIMQQSHRIHSTLIQSCTLALAFLAMAGAARGQIATNWIWFNDYNQSLQPVAGTHSNATVYNVRSGPGGPLKDIASGQFVLANLVVTATGGDGPDDFGASADANPGTPAYNLFNGFVDVGGVDGQPDDGAIGLRSSEMNVITLTFTNLDPSKKYVFRGTAVRGNNYNDRWSIYEIQGAAAYVDAHVDNSAAPQGTNIFSQSDGRFPAANLSPGQVVLHSGENRVGSLVGWNEIEPGPDGSFSIAQRHWIGATPFGNAPAAAATLYGYAMQALMLAEVGTPEPVTIITQPAAQTTVEEFRPFTLSVVAGGSPPPRYQWYKQGSGAIPGATARNYTVALATMADSGDYYVIASNTINSATSIVARVTVVDDTNAPIVVRAVGNASLDRVYVEFDELLNTSTSTQGVNYSISPPLAVTGDGTIASGGRGVFLPTDPQTPGTLYTVTVMDVFDLAGNVVTAPNNTAQFRAWVPTQCGGLVFEVYNGTPGPATVGQIVSTSVAVLTNHATFPNSPSERFVLTSFSSRGAYPDDTHENYGGRIRGLFFPPESGNWKFYLRGDDGAEIWLNPNGPNAAGRTRIAYQAGFIGGAFDEGTPGARTSAPIPLTAGQAYYLEGLYQEQTGGDYLEVAAKLESDPTPAASLTPIPGSLLGSSAAPPNVVGPAVIVQQPASATNQANTRATFSVVASNALGANICYQWQRSDDGGANFADIPGATGTSFTTGYLTEADDNGDIYRVVVNVVGSSVVSANAVLTVTADTVRPTVTRVLAINDTNIVVLFSEPLPGQFTTPPGTGDDPTAYQVDDGTTIIVGTAVISTSNPLRVDLYLSSSGLPMTLGNTYTLTVSTDVTPIADAYGNAIDPNPTMVTFRAQNFAGNVENLVTLSTNGMLPAGSLTDRGFAGRLVQVSQNIANANIVTEQLLAGVYPSASSPLPNIAPVHIFWESNSINYNRDAPGGTSVGSLTPDVQFPGYPPGPTTPEAVQNNMAMEVITYLHLQTGIHQFGVNSDDGFTVSPALSAQDPNNSTLLGSFNGGRGTADTLFNFCVTREGLYPFRLTWEQGQSGGNLEWWAVNLNSATPARNAINVSPAPEAYTPPCTAKSLTSAISLDYYYAIITWPSAGGGNLFGLQSSPSLSSPVWSWVQQIPQDVAGNKQVTVPLGAGNQFFRLYKGAPPVCP